MLIQNWSRTRRKIAKREKWVSRTRNYSIMVILTHILASRFQFYVTVRVNNQ